MPRWDVQLAGGTEDVGAKTMYIDPSGALVFEDDGPITVAYSPHRWLMVVRTEEDD